MNQPITGRAILLGIAIAALILIVYFTWRQCDNTRRDKAAEHITNSNGGYDNAALAAISELTNISAKTPADHFQHGRLLQLNVLGGNTGSAHSQTIADIANDYELALALQDNYTTAAHVIEPEFMIHHIADFALDLVGTAIQINFGDGQLTKARTATAKKRRELIMTGQGTTPVSNHGDANNGDANNGVSQGGDTSKNTLIPARNQLTTAMFNDASTYTSDPQNAHDSSVNGDLRGVLHKLTDSAGGISPAQAISEAVKYIESERASEEWLSQTQAANAKTILTKISLGTPIMAFNTSEDNIFAVTWARCAHPRNMARADLMRRAIITALSESIERGIPTCVNGRSSRVLNSLATLDFDIDVASGALTYEAYRNQAFQDVKTKVNEIVDSADSTTVDAYYAGEPSAEQLKQEIRGAIDECIEKYRNKFHPGELPKLISDCYIYSLVD